MWKKSAENSSLAPLSAESRSDVGSFEKQGHKTSQSIMSPSLTIQGEISGNEDLVLEGLMEGTVNLPENEIHVGPSGQIKANLTALRVSVEGKVSGDIRGNDQVLIKQSARVEGNIIAPRVVLEDGCQFKGSVQMNPEPQSAPKPGHGEVSKTRTQAPVPKTGYAEKKEPIPTPT